MRLSTQKLGVCWCLVVLVTLVQSVYIEPTRVKRGIFGTVTSTVYKTVQEKVYVPASCVYAAPNLPECRNVRFLNSQFDSSSFKLFNIGNELLPASPVKAPQSAAVNQRIDNESNSVEHVPTWGEYLGFYRPTVTLTSIKIEPTTVVDSRIMVTYDIRGCKPHALPFDLPKCIEDSLEAAEIIPTTTVATNIKSTRLVEAGRSLPEDLEGSESFPSDLEFQGTTQRD